MRKLFKSFFADEAKQPEQRFDKLRNLLDSQAVEDHVPAAWTEIQW